jgi:hypothetical protein
LSDSELRLIGDAAQARVLSQHTSEIRARQFEAAIVAASQKGEIDADVGQEEAGVAQLS